MIRDCRLPEWLSEWQRVRSCADAGGRWRTATSRYTPRRWRLWACRSAFGTKRPTPVERAWLVGVW